MNSSAVKKIEIIRELAQVSEDDLDRIQAYIRSILPRPETSPGQRQSLKGIWKGLGFERLENLEAEVREARKDLTDSILNKTL